MPNTSLPSLHERAAHVEATLGRLRTWLGERQLDGVILALPANVAWVTGGLGAPVDRSAALDAVRVVVGGAGLALVVTEVEQDRLVDEAEPAALGFEVLAVPWFAGGGYLDEAARAFLDRPASRLGTDVAVAGAQDVAGELLRLRLTHSEQAAGWLRRLGRDASEAMEVTLAGWCPGDTDRSVQARLVQEIEQRGAEAVVVLVGGDERVERYRHPVAVGAATRSLVMAVVVARRQGLHVALTRFVSAGRLPVELARRFEAVLAVEAAVLAACRPGQSYGAALLALAQAYRDVGCPDAWREHYQGGPIGYQQRELELAPVDTGSRWWEQEIAARHAVAWNPSLAGGAKVEDTFLVGSQGLECLTDPIEWPLASCTGVHGIRRPSVLQLD